MDHGSLVVSPTPPEPVGLNDGSAAAVLDEAEDILNAAGSDIRAQLDAERKDAAKRGLFKRIFRRKS